LSTFEGRLEAWKGIQTYADNRHFNGNQKNELARQLADHLHLDFDRFLSRRFLHLMTPGEVKEICKKGVDIQLHTHRHRTPLDKTLFLQEILENRRCLEELTGRTPRHFCYPSGYYKPQFLPWLSEQGINSATTCDHGLADARTNSLLLPRFLDSSSVSSIDFESWLLGIGRIFPRNPLRRRPHITRTEALMRMFGFGV
jgi:peptidoglycan/xylan/chitin deacetylase (PgdA/CDA1 family)